MKKVIFVKELDRFILFLVWSASVQGTASLVFWAGFINKTVWQSHMRSVHVCGELGIKCCVSIPLCKIFDYYLKYASFYHIFGGWIFKVAHAFRYTAFNHLISVTCHFMLMDLHPFSAWWCVLRPQLSVCWKTRLRDLPFSISPLSLAETQYVSLDKKPLNFPDILHRATSGWDFQTSLILTGLICIILFIESYFCF